MIIIIFLTKEILQLTFSVYLYLSNSGNYCGNLPKRNVTGNFASKYTIFTVNLRKNFYNHNSTTHNFSKKIT